MSDHYQGNFIDCGGATTTTAFMLCGDEESLTFDQIKKINPADILYVECDGSNGYMEHLENGCVVCGSEVVYKIHVKKPYGFIQREVKDDTD